MKNVQWVESTSPNFMDNAIEGGKYTNGDSIYIGRAENNGDLFPGQYNNKWPGLWSSNG